MPIEWVKVGTDVVVGGGAGAVDQLVQNADEKRIAAKPDLGIMSQYGTYYNYGVPILAILGVAFGFLKGDWATRGVVVGSQLAGRKATQKLTKKAPVPWTGWSRQEAQRQQLAAAARARAGGAATPAGVGLDF